MPDRMFVRFMSDKLRRMSLGEKLVEVKRLNEIIVALERAWDVALVDLQDAQEIFGLDSVEVAIAEAKEIGLVNYKKEVKVELGFVASHVSSQIVEVSLAPRAVPAKPRLTQAQAAVHRRVEERKRIIVGGPAVPAITRK